MEEVPFLKPLTLDLNPQKSPWVYFSLFGATLFILSYSSLPFTVKSAIALFSGVLPLYLALRTSSKPGPHEEPAYLKEFGLPLPLGLGIIGLFFALRSEEHTSEL